MSSSFKKAISVVATAFLVLVAYYGSYLPLRKSQAYIEALGKLSTVASLQDFQNSFAVPLDFFAPIGQEELVRNTASVVLQAIQGSGKAHPEAVQPLLDFINQYFKPILERNRGMSFNQDLYIMGTIYDAAFVQKNDHPTEYLAEAETYFMRGFALGQKRPQFLYGLLDTYRLKGDASRAGDVARQILTLWPNDERVKAMFVKQ